MFIWVPDNFEMQMKVKNFALKIDSKPERKMYLPTDVSSSDDNGIETILVSPLPSLSLPDISHNNDNN